MIQVLDGTCIIILDNWLVRNRRKIIYIYIYIYIYIERERERERDLPYSSFNLSSLLTNFPIL